MKGYIYKILNKENGKFYIGSTVEPQKREKRHFNDLQKNKHHCIFLQRSFDKYGIDCFEFLPREVTIADEKELRLLEERYIRFCWDSGKLYNTSKKGSGGDLISYHPNNKEFRELQRKLSNEKYSNMSIEERKQLSEKMKGTGNPNYGNHWTREMRERASAFFKEFYSKHDSYQKGKTFEEIFGEERAKELKQKMSERSRKLIGEKNGFYGKHHTSEAKEKMRNARLGKKPTNAKKVYYNGKVYESANDCGKKLGIPIGTIAYRCRKELYGFKYIENNANKMNISG